ncbi:hypothetical protein LSTR_LSTR009904 [Laodelphax striatellus]|uniref:4a-hydroxytetrahydrobiopterin dehydratase n=1 Tax=Laodelphax striatellus TaxID=195883 RepID=A0A482WKN4_LAOST|nr:hypothetical protein LSTR_LSTR009904 [Laodelphax striatellus]
MTCPICVQEISKGTIITCFGTCKRKFHLTCLTLSVEDSKRILEKDMKWKCDVKYCFIGDGYDYFINYKQKEMGYLVSKIQYEIDNIDKLFKSYSSSVQNITNGLNDFQEEIRKLKDRYDERSPQEKDKLPNVSPKPITLDELVSNGWVANKNKKLLKKSFEFESGSSAISFINRTTKELEKEPINNMPQITLQIKTVTVILASKEQEDKVDNMMLKTANMIDGAAPRTLKIIPNAPKIRHNGSKPIHAFWRRKIHHNL